MPYGYIYMVLNTVTGKKYIGQTTQEPTQRFNQHLFRRASHCKALSAAISKYGQDAFEFSIIAESASKDELDRAEIAAIELHNTLAPHGYNIKTGGSFGKHSENTKERIGAKHKGRLASPETIAKHRARMLGSSPSAETRAKIAAALKGNKISEVNKAALRAANLGRKPSDESRRKMSQNRSGIPVSEEKKEKLRLANLGKHHSDETRARMAASQVARWAVRKSGSATCL
jgi:group I intron endonuclease